jgi:hypothetical protein
MEEGGAENLTRKASATSGKLSSPTFGDKQQRNSKPVFLLMAHCSVWLTRTLFHAMEHLWFLRGFAPLASCHLGNLDAHPPSFSFPLLSHLSNHLEFNTSACTFYLSLISASKSSECGSS